MNYIIEGFLAVIFMVITLVVLLIPPALAVYFFDNIYIVVVAFMIGFSFFIAFISWACDNITFFGNFF